MRWVQTFHGGRSPIYADSYGELLDAVREAGAWGDGWFTGLVTHAQADPNLAAGLTTHTIREIGGLTVGDMTAQLKTLDVSTLKALLWAEAQGAGRRGVWDAIKLELKSREA